MVGGDKSGSEDLPGVVWVWYEEEFPGRLCVRPITEDFPGTLAIAVDEHGDFKGVVTVPVPYRIATNNSFNGTLTVAAGSTGADYRGLVTVGYVYFNQLKLRGKITYSPTDDPMNPGYTDPVINIDVGGLIV